jgi:threonyl-tRNA synthetase
VRNVDEVNNNVKGRLLDHQQIGAQQELWFSHGYAPGSSFFLPGGAHIYNNTTKRCRRRCSRRSAVTADALARSGHLDHYEDDMFLWSHDGKRVGLKPMSCPCRCLMLGHRARS